MSRGIFAKIYPRRTLDRVDKKVKLMGVNSHVKALTILNLRVFISLLLFIIILFFTFSKPILNFIISFYILFDKLLFHFIRR